MKPSIRIKPPGPKARKILARDSSVISQSMVRAYELVIEKAYGVNFQDVEGNVYLDFNSGIATMNFGHSNPIITQAIKQQLEKATHPAFLEFYSQLPVTFCEELTKLMPNGLNTVFLSNSGAESVEAAMKLSRYHTGRKYFLAFYGAFHGRTMGALSLTASKSVQRARFGPFLSAIHAPYAYPYRSRYPDDEDACAKECIEYIEDEIFDKMVPPDEFAAIFVEPVQGESGYIVPPRKFLQELRRICDEHRILLVDDEVQSGCFRTGKFLAIEHFGVKPDIVCLAKALGGGLPLGATISPRDIMDWPRGAHANTFGGNLLACAAGKAVLSLMKKRGLGYEVERKGQHIMKYLRDLQKNKKILGDVRGLGLMIGVEFVEDRRTKKPAEKLRDRIVKTAFEKGLAILSAGKSSIRIAPPLIIERDDIDAGLGILSDSIELSQKAL